MLPPAAPLGQSPLRPALPRGARRAAGAAGSRRAAAAGGGSRPTPAARWRALAGGSVAAGAAAAAARRGARRRRHPAWAAAAPAAPEVREVSVGEVLRFVWPVTLSLLASTVQGLIDSGFVGRCGGPLELAALAPATSLVEGLSYLLSFVAIGTLNVLAVAGAEPGKAELERLLSRSLVAALLVGLVAAGVILAGASWGVRLCGAEGAMVPLAASYASIRAIGLPFDLAFRVANAGLLATRDSRTGLLVVLGQSVINGVGDALACPSLGIAGAAMTTVIAQAAGCFAALLTLWRRKLLTRFQPPPLAEVLSFIGFALPVCLTLALKVATVQFLNASASGRGVLEAAGHQVTKSIFWAFGLLASESLSSTAQAFLPPALQRGDRAEANRTLRLLLLLGTCGGILTASLLGLSIACGGLGLFSRDAGVLATVPALPLCLCVLSTPYSFCLEGAHIAAQRQRWLSQRLLVLTTLAAISFQAVPGGLRGLWVAFGTYIVSRAVWYAWGLWGPGGVLAVMERKDP